MVEYGRWPRTRRIVNHEERYRASIREGEKRWNMYRTLTVEEVWIAARGVLKHGRGVHRERSLP